ncbi:Bifunctional arginine demethylase and lysyl-hydroxylase JMJD6 [Hondaea fermentalgiana]|uniref:Bifunctional arginine demethylase and lysyl-hydroxylase JMJD6 n=1 Tax=Hondaea fermentalgiana TaxID=2315210 RepID=A0A2R5GTS6_9STRA|nr:Bifunctional arginine demethylase and lysyl-hydroxylase JMJD6 [Hondaea fermentalgiana]|eukprot:GBG31294.1 Bifunctional arginine demethylase and lysyl-hydroxylase JMJD6 [Hondaea fermentalgiana]
MTSTAAGAGQQSAGGATREAAAAKQAGAEAEAERKGALDGGAPKMDARASASVPGGGSEAGSKGSEDQTPRADSPAGARAAATKKGAAAQEDAEPACPSGEDTLLQRSEALWAAFYTDELEGLVGKPFGGRTAKIMRSAKREHRTDMSARGWDKYGHHKRWEKVRATLKERNLDNVRRIHGDCYSLERFRKEFELPAQPCLIHGLADAWPARTEWGLKRLREDFGERKFKCGEDDEGYAIKVKLKHFLRYMNSDNEDGAKLDDSPLYIFDSHFDDDRISKQLLQEYRVPHLFQEDLFRHVGERRRPPYRWILIGSERSGSGVHDDPLGTSAWNTLVRGHKLWTLFPPDVPRSVVKGRSLVDWKNEDDEPVDWNEFILPRILEKGGPELRSKMIQFIQKPGETVFVPSDWWHAVLNLDTTVAVTQNFCSTGNFDRVWRQTRTGRRKMARTWRRTLQLERDDLAKRAYELDKMDNFDLDQEIEAADERRRRRKIAKKEAKKRKRQQQHKQHKLAKKSDPSDGNEADDDQDDNDGSAKDAKSTGSSSGSSDSESADGSGSGSESGSGDESDDNDDNKTKNNNNN